MTNETIDEQIEKLISSFSTPMEMQGGRYCHYGIESIDKINAQCMFSELVSELERLSGYRKDFDFFFSFSESNNKASGIVIEVLNEGSDVPEECKDVLAHYGVKEVDKEIQEMFASRVLSLCSSAPSTVLAQEKHIRISLPRFTR